MILAVSFLAACAVWLTIPSRPLARLEAPTAVAVGVSPRRSGWSWPRRIVVALLALALVWWLMPSALGAVLGLLAGGGAVVATGYIRAPEDTGQAARELPDALDFLAVCLKAGAPIQVAIATVADISPPTTAGLLRRVLSHFHVGRSTEESWAELKEHPVWGLAARDLVRSARSGISLVDVLRLHAEDARQAQKDRDTKRARTVGVKSVVPLMACFLPAFVLVGVVPIVASLLGSFFG